MLVMKGSNLGKPRAHQAARVVKLNSVLFLYIYDHMVPGKDRRINQRGKWYKLASISSPFQWHLIFKCKVNDATNFYSVNQACRRGCNADARVGI